MPFLPYTSRTACLRVCVCVSLTRVQVQMQADVRAVLSGQRQHRQFSSIRSVAAALTQQAGVRGLWRGGLPAVQRAALVNLGELSTYDSVSEAASRSGLCWGCCMPARLKATVLQGLCLCAQCVINNCTGKWVHVCAHLTHPGVACLPVCLSVCGSSCCVVTLAG